MSQRTHHLEKEITIDLSFKVTLKSFSNHNGFSEKQIENAIEEFKEKIQKELEHKVNGEYCQQEFLQSVDFVSYEADSQNGL
jgi:NADPH-dependent 7-cyano-7-deazaguanine reductase QueF